MTETPTYDQDGLRTIHNHEFMDDPAFQTAYARGVQASGPDYAWHWRVHGGVWAARHAAHLSGDFVECGVGKGFMSSTIMAALDWDRTGRTFYLLDTFSGIDERYITPAERADGILARNAYFFEKGIYVRDPDGVVANFAQWRNVKIIVGAVPETLTKVRSAKIAFLHLDMNCAPPEVAAFAHFWDRLVPGAAVLMDDYAYHGYREQKLALDAFAATQGVSILSMPTGQGLLIRPPKPKAGLAGLLGRR